ncbi:MAG: Rieske 2Fe-2S domain-containing protein [Bdellovibrionales bacterium]
MNEGTEFLGNIWYHAVPSDHLRKGQMLKRQYLGQPIILLRDKEGKASALRDVCPHRGIPLSYGQFDGAEVECCYHGWRFKTDGQCCAIPSLCGGEGVNVEKIRVKHYPTHEAQGQVWIYMGDGDADASFVPVFPDIGERQPSVILQQEFPCHIDHAVVGLMDPAHGPFVHQSWFWRTQRSIHEKAKAFGPRPYGWAMERHRPSSNSKAYKILGGVPETEITFKLPGVRIEHIRVGKNSVVNLTCVTPIDDKRTMVTNCVYWTAPWMVVLAPIVKFFGGIFLGQDKRAVEWQQEGLKFEKNLLLIKDADTQARWYYQLKNEYTRAAAEGREFNNPVKETTLRWRS